MIAPFLEGAAFLRDIAEHRDAARLWWLGQSGFMIRWQNRTLLLDPYLSDSLTRKYAGTDKPHVRMTQQVVSPAALDFIDGVVSTHNHTDHLDGDTLQTLRSVNKDLALIIPEANRAFVANRLRCDPGWPIGLDDGMHVTVAGFRFTGIPSAHEVLHTNEQGQHHFLGYIVRFGPWTLYHPGDTMLYDGLVKRLQRWTIDVAFLPINGRDPTRRVAGNLSGIEAARLAHDTGIRLVIPCHYDMFEFNTASPDAFVREARSLGQSYRILRNGEGLTLR